MAIKLVELEAVYLRECVRRGDWCVIACRMQSADGDGTTEQMTVTADEDELTPMLSYRFYGHWTEHEKYGRQFVCKTFVRCEPFGRSGVIRYLQLTCPGCGLGPATAVKLWEKFRSDAVRILRESPDVAAAAIDARQFTPEMATKASTLLQREKHLEACHLELMDLLAGRGFPKAIVKKAIKEWGNRAAGLLKRNPFLLMRFRGCGFLGTDRMYTDLGGNPDALKRQALCVWNAMARDTTGSTWHRPAAVEKQLKGKVASTRVRPVEAVTLAKRAGIVAVHRNGDGSPWFAEGRKARNEEYVAQRIAELANESAEWPNVGPLDVSEHQRDCLRRALCGGVVLFGGSPGTGKTYSAARVIAASIELFGSEEVAVAAPTGKAAVRISEALAAYRVPIRARTIHSLLGVAGRSEGEGWGFMHGEDCPLPYRLVVVDESSMIDTDLMASLLRACGRGTQVLFVGDVNQLPPVGHGRPLYDAIAAGIPYGELRDIKRQAVPGLIVEACAAIRDGVAFQTCDELAPASGRNLKLAATSGNAASVEAIVHRLKIIRQSKIFDAVWECQVVVAVNAKSELSRREVNKRLQAELNPCGKHAGGNPFRVGDKIVCLKNGFVPQWDRSSADADEETQTNDSGDVFVANGEQARVLESAERYTIAELWAPARTVKIPRGKQSDAEESDGDEAAYATGTGCNWDLAYAISCHKSQGSEWPCVLVALDEYPGARLVCSRNWLYTAISRAKQVGLLVGKRATADAMCRRDAISGRKTFLKELILEKRATLAGVKS